MAKDLTKVVDKTEELIRQSRALLKQSERVIQRCRQELDGEMGRLQEKDADETDGRQRRPRKRK